MKKISITLPEKYILLTVLFFIGLLYFRFLPVTYDFDGTVCSQHLRYALAKENIIPVLQPHHLLYLPSNYILYKSLHWLTGYQVLEYFHLQFFSLIFGLLTLGVSYKILKNIINDRFFSIAGVLMMVVSFGIWYYSVEAEVDMPGLFFIASGIYLLLFKSFNTKNIIFSALLFSIAACFHLTNGLILFSVLLFFIIEKKSVLWFIKFALFYIFFLAVPYLIFYLVTGLDFFTHFKNQLFGPDIFTGYKISYWSGISIESVLNSLKSIGYGIVSSSSAFLSFFSLFFFVSIAAAVALSNREKEDKKIYYMMISWMLPYFLFFSIWSSGNVGFKLNILMPLFILFTFSFSRLDFKGRPTISVRKRLFIIIIILLFVSNFFFTMLPGNELENNVYYQFAAAISAKTADNSLIIIAGCGSKVSIYSKIYIPYFAGRKTLVLDWILGNGMSLDDIHARIKQEISKGKVVYFNSEILQESKTLNQLLKNHKLQAADYFNFLGRLDLKEKIPLIGDYYLKRL